MRQRLLKYLKRFLIFLLILGLLGLALFSWLLYWPFEGSVDDVLTLVPEDVDFVLRTDYDELRKTGWVQENVLEDPLMPDLGEQAARVLDQIDLELGTIQAQIDQQSPIAVDVKSFVQEHVLAGEICIAGNFWEGSNLARGQPPQWKELLVLKKVSRIARGVSGLQHGFIREQVQLGPDVELSAESDGIYKFTLRGMAPTQRSAADRRPGDPDMSQWFMVRIKDVIAVSNRRSIIEDVISLGEDPNGASFARRPGFEIPNTPGRVNAAVNLAPLHGYLNRAFDYYTDLRVLRRFLPPAALVKLSGHVSLEGTDLLSGAGAITYVDTTEESANVNRGVYSLPPREVASGIASLVPAKDTFAVLSLRTNPEYLLNEILWQSVPQDVRRLWSDNLRQNPEAGFATVPELFEDLSTRMGNEAMVAIGRMGEIYDKVDFVEWYSEEPEPLPALAIMVRVGEGTTQQELEEFIAGKIFLLGMEKELERVTHGNFTYSKAALKIETLDFKYVSPCFIVVQDHLVMTSSEGYMRRILDTVADAEGKALAQDETFRVTMGALPPTGHVGLFVDLEKLTRVPDSIRADPDDPDFGPPGTRGFLWDQRNSWVIQNKDERREAIRFRREERRKFPQRLNDQQEAELDSRVDRHIDTWLDRYPDFLEEYRRSLEGYRRFRGIGLVLGARGGNLDARFAGVLRKRDGAP